MNVSFPFIFNITLHWSLFEIDQSIPFTILLHFSYLDIQTFNPINVAHLTSSPWPIFLFIIIIVSNGVGEDPPFPMETFGFNSLFLWSLFFLFPFQQRGKRKKLYMFLSLYMAIIFQFIINWPISLIRSVSVPSSYNKYEFFLVRLLVVFIFLK